MNRKPQKTSRSISTILKRHLNKIRLPFAYFQRDNEKHLVAITYLLHFTIHKAVCSSSLFLFALWVEHRTSKLDYFIFHTTWKIPVMIPVVTCCYQGNREPEYSFL